jgi:hypothetical protein
VAELSSSPLAFEVALFGCFGVSVDVFPCFSYSYSAVAVLVLEERASSTSTSTISLSTSTIKDKTRNFKAVGCGLKENTAQAVFWALH